MVNELVVMPGADHAFFNDTGQRYNPDAAADAWQRVRRGSQHTWADVGQARASCTLCGTCISRSTVTRSRPPTAFPAIASATIWPQSA